MTDITVKVGRENTQVVMPVDISSQEIVNAIRALVNALRDRHSDMDEEMFDYKLYASIRSRGKILNKEKIEKKIILN